MTFIPPDVPRQSDVHVVRGRSIAHRRLNRPQRELFGAKVILGEVSLVDLTQGQVARALKVSESGIAAKVRELLARRAREVRQPLKDATSAASEVPMVSAKMSALRDQLRKLLSGEVRAAAY
jgi:hypothetical protein